MILYILLLNNRKVFNLIMKIFHLFSEIHKEMIINALFMLFQNLEIQINTEALLWNEIRPLVEIILIDEIVICFIGRICRIAMHLGKTTLVILLYMYMFGK